MIRSRSMENLEVLPDEEAKLAASLLRLTLSDNQESAFQSYLGKHHQFPYHKALHITTASVKRSEPISISDDGSNKKGISSSNRRRRQCIQSKSYPRERSGSSPSNICPADEENTTTDSPVTPSSYVNSSCRLSSSAPAEGSGFFQRFVPAFLRRRLSSTSSSSSTRNENDGDNASTTTTTQETSTFAGINEKESVGHFVQYVNQTTAAADRMEDFIFMSMR